MFVYHYLNNNLLGLFTFWVPNVFVKSHFGSYYIICVVLVPNVQNMFLMGPQVGQRRQGQIGKIVPQTIWKERSLPKSWVL